MELQPLNVIEKEKKLFPIIDEIEKFLDALKEFLERMNTFIKTVSIGDPSS